MGCELRGTTTGIRNSVTLWVSAGMHWKIHLYCKFTVPAVNHVNHDVEMHGYLGKTKSPGPWKLISLITNPVFMNVSRVLCWKPSCYVSIKDSLKSHVSWGTILRRITNEIMSIALRFWNITKLTLNQQICLNPSNPKQRRESKPIALLLVELNGIL